MLRIYLDANATIYSNDGKLANAAEGRIEVINIGESHGTNT